MWRQQLFGSKLLAVVNLGLSIRQFCSINSDQDPFYFALIIVQVPGTSNNTEYIWAEHGPTPDIRAINPSR